jgi:hypothetical protein
MAEETDSFVSTLTNFEHDLEHKSDGSIAISSEAIQVLQRIQTLIKKILPEDDTLGGRTTAAKRTYDKITKEPRSDTYLRRLCYPIPNHATHRREFKFEHFEAFIRAKNKLDIALQENPKQIPTDLVTNRHVAAYAFLELFHISTRLHVSKG